jgi:hypothetical protein
MLGTGIQGVGIFYLLYGALFFLAIATHMVWASRIALAVWNSGWSLPLKRALIMTVTVTRILGFYGGMIIRYFRQPARPLTVTRWTFIMPLLAPAAVLVFAIGDDLRYTPSDWSWSNVAGSIPGILAFYIVMQVILYMAACVFRLSHNGPLASRTHLISAMTVVTIALLARYT